MLSGVLDAIQIIAELWSSEIFSLIFNNNLFEKMVLLVDILLSYWLGKTLLVGCTWRFGIWIQVVKVNFVAVLVFKSV
jgi:hypothetical protein